MSKIIYTVCDPRYFGGQIVEVEALPKDAADNKGFIYWRGELREVNEIHITANGVQMELIN